MGTLFEHNQIYEMVGGSSTFHNLATHFYELVQNDELLIFMYPKKLDMAIHKLALFLIQKFGGPDEYRPLRGHPQMRRRHFEFPIDSEARNRWLNHMLIALDKVGIDSNHKARFTLEEYFSWMSTHMINKS